jgi:hypothetical protein
MLLHGHLDLGAERERRVRAGERVLVEDLVARGSASVAAVRVVRGKARHGIDTGVEAEAPARSTV